MDELTKTNPKTFEVLKELYPWASQGELYLKAQETFDNTGDQDYMDFENKWKAKYPNEVTPNTKSSDQSFSTTTYVPGGGGTTILKPQGSIAGSLAPFGDKINQAIAQSKTSVVFEYGSIPTVNPKEGIVIRKAIDGYFLGKPLAANDIFTEVTEDGVETKPGSEYADYEVGQVGWNGYRNIYEIQLNKKGDKSQTKTIHMDGRTLSNPELNNYTGAPETRYMSAIHESLTGLSAGESTKRTLQATFENKNGQTQQVPLSLNIIAGDSFGNATLTITNPDGSPINVPGSDATVTVKDGNGNTKKVPKKMRMDDPYIKQIISLPGMKIY